MSALKIAQFAKANLTYSRENIIAGSVERKYLHFLNFVDWYAVHARITHGMRLVTQIRRSECAIHAIKSGQNTR